MFRSQTSENIFNSLLIVCSLSWLAAFLMLVWEAVKEARMIDRVVLGWRWR